MDLDPGAAAASLREITRAEQHTMRAVVYDVSSAILLLWGVAVGAGYLGTQFHPERVGLIWPVVWGAGFVGTGLRLGLRARNSRPGAGVVIVKLLSAQLALFGFGALMLWLVGPLDGRQLNAFWPLIVMLGYMLAGLWVGAFFIVCAIIVVTLTIVGYLFSGPWFALWMAAANGGALIVGGLWLRRAGLRS